MKKLALLCTVLLSPLAALADGYDIIGGPDAGAQTMHHCGFTVASGGHYTNSPITTILVEKKLKKLGYAGATPNGYYGKADKKAVRAYQADRGIQVDGIVGPVTAKHLAYDSHPAANVHRCYRNASAR